MSTREKLFWVAAIALLLTGLSLFFIVVEGQYLRDRRDTVRTSAIALLQSCKGAVEILRTGNGSLLISCSPAEPEQPKNKDSTKRGDV